MDEINDKATDTEDINNNMAEAGSVDITTGEVIEPDTVEGEAMITDEAMEAEAVEGDNQVSDYFVPGVGDKKTILSGMFRNWYLEYASYVILERAVPHIEDGLKPVQRRILHAMQTLDDGRYNKVANVVGHTMQYHPHGDASIGDALVQLGQKELLMTLRVTGVTYSPVTRRRPHVTSRHVCRNLPLRQSSIRK